MIDFKTLRSYVIYTLLVVCGFAMFYFGTAFVTLEMNFVNWEEDTRFFVIIEGTITSIGLILMYKINKK